METILNYFLTRLMQTDIVLVLFGFIGFIWLKFGLRAELSEVKSDINQFKSEIKSDFNNLTDAVEAMAFTLEKNGHLELKDKEYVVRKLSR